MSVKVDIRKSVEERPMKSEGEERGRNVRVGGSGEVFCYIGLLVPFHHGAQAQH